MAESDATADTGQVRKPESLHFEVEEESAVMVLYSRSR